jgi:hypothetical protein
MVAFCSGDLPEMHVWSAIPATGELVDLSVGFQPEQARRLCDFVWSPEFQLPVYLWGKPQPPRLCYRASPLACKMAAIFLNEFHYHRAEPPPRKTVKSRHVKTGMQNNESKCS